MTHIKMVRHTLFSSPATGVGTTTVPQRVTEIEPYSKYNKEMWECIVKKQGRGQWVGLNKIPLNKF